MRGVPTRGRGLSRRQTSEKALLDAFEALLQRHGPGGLGVNAVLDSAGVGKRLLYEYFGDLEGLATAWARERSDPLALEGRKKPLLRRLAALDAPSGIAATLAHYATELRHHHWATQVLLAELSQPATLGKAMREIRIEMGKDYERLLIEADAFDDERGVQLAFVLHAAATYLAMRARFAPDYNGVDLSSPQGWKAAMAAIAAVGRIGSKGRVGHGKRPAATRRRAPASATDAGQPVAFGPSRPRPRSRSRAGKP